MRRAGPEELLKHARFLLDTNVISHLIRPKQHLYPGIVHFFETVDEDRLYLSTITIGEIQKGIDLIPWPRAEAERETRRRLQGQLEQRLEALCDRFESRIVEPDVRVARQWGRFHAERERAGNKSPVIDTMIAACAHTNHLVIASADGDFATFDDVLTVYNPRTQTISGYRFPLPPGM